MSVVFLNGELLPSDQAKISVFDRGFLLGDGVYEVIPAYSGVLFRLDEHLQRLQNSLDEIRLDNPYVYDEWVAMLNRLVAKNYASDLSVYLQVTRGIAVRAHAFPADIKPTVFAMTNPITPLSESYYEQGVACVTVEDNRWTRCNVKAISLLPNVLLHQQAVDQGAIEAILCRKGHITEGAACNIFAVFGNELATPPKSAELLPGITRDLILELAQENGIQTSECEITLEEFKLADEVWLTSSTKEILPVTKLNDQPVGDGKPGKVFQAMREIYKAYKQKLHAQEQLQVRN